MFNYNPKDAKKLFDPGDYSAELTSFEEKLTKTGKPMLVVNLQVYPHDAGQAILLRDWIVAPDSIWKLKKLAGALGVSDKFENQTFDPNEFRGCSVVVSLKVKDDEKYGEQNTVTGYKAQAKEPSGVFTKRSANVQETVSTPSFHESASVDAEIPF